MRRNEEDEVRKTANILVGSVFLSAALAALACAQEQPRSAAPGKSAAQENAKPAAGAPAKTMAEHPDPVQMQRPEPDQRLAQFRKLAGEWQGKDPEAGDAEMHVQYQVTGAGSAVVETLFPGTPHEMVTVVHYDKGDLLLTHYCALGNQPRMKAEPAARPAGDTGTAAVPKSIKFVFQDGTNMQSPNDPHMHAVTYTFIDDDHLKAEWVYYKDGKPAMEPTAFVLTRVKSGAAEEPQTPAKSAPGAAK